MEGPIVPEAAGRPRANSEGALFQNSYDYTTPYPEQGGKNGADLALELLGAKEAPFDVSGHLRAPAWVGGAMAYPPVPPSLGGVKKREPSAAARRSMLLFGLTLDKALEGVEEAIALGATSERAASAYTEVAPDHVDMVPRLVRELVEDKLVPAEYADLPPESIAKMFQINPRATPQAQKPAQQSISFTTNSEGRNIIKHATLADVVKTFATEAQDNQAIQRLLLAHEQFVDSRTLFTQFTEYFELHQSSSAPDQIIQARILNVLKRWIEMSWPEMRHNGLSGLMIKFIGSLDIKLKAILEKAISASERQGRLDAKEGAGAGSPQTKPKKAKSKKGEEQSLLDFDSQEIAKQLTLIDYELAQNVNLNEMLKAQWVDDAAPTLFAASKRVNDLTYWLAHQVVSTVNAKKRIKMIQHIIKIAKHLLAYNSFNSFMAVYLAFNLPSTARLTNTWKGVAAKHFTLWKKMSKIMSPMNNFGAYREIIETLQPPMVICQEVLLKDLLYEEEGRPDFVGDNQLDMTKMDEVGRLIDFFRFSRSKPYPFQMKESNLEDFLKDIPSWPSAEEAAQKLDELSRVVEPSSINFPTAMTSDVASRVRSLGNMPTSSWKKEPEPHDRPQYSNPTQSPRGGPSAEEEPVSPRAAAISPKLASGKTRPSTSAHPDRNPSPNHPSSTNAAAGSTPSPSKSRKPFRKASAVADNHSTSKHAASSSALTDSQEKDLSASSSSNH